MLCPICGSEVGDSIRFCEKCGGDESLEGRGREEARASYQAALEKKKNVSTYIPIEDAPYAGFWLRAFSYLIDYFVLTIPSAILALLFGVSVFGKVFSSLGGLMLKRADSDLAPKFLALEVITDSAIFILTSMLLWIVYYAAFESSKYLGTPGKIVSGLIVTDLEGNKVSFGRAALRRFYFAVVPMALFFITILLTVVFASVVKSKAVVLIVWVLFPLAFVGDIGAMLFNSRKQTLHDWASGCLVKARLYDPVPRVAVGLIGAIAGSLIVNSAVSGVIGSLVASQIDPSKFNIDPTKFKVTHNSRVITGAKQPLVAFSGTPVSTSASSTSVNPGSSAIPVPNLQVEVTPMSNELYDKAVDGFRGRIAANQVNANIKTVVGMLYPAGNVVGIALFTEPRTKSDIDLLISKGSVSASVNNRKPDMVLSIEFEEGAREVTEKNIKSYTTYFYQNNFSEFSFPGAIDAVSFKKQYANIKPPEILSISGVLTKGKKINLKAKGFGSPIGNPTVFRWDLNYEVELR